MRTGSLERKNNKFQIEKQCDIIRTIFIIKSDRSVNVQMTASLLIAVIYLIFISLGLHKPRTSGFTFRLRMADDADVF